MATLGPRTRSRARAETAMLQGISINQIPTTTETNINVSSLAQNMENKSSNARSSIAPEGVLRQGSLIPAYKYDDKIDDISLECMMGTPFTVEIKAKYASKIADIATAEKKTGVSAVIVQSKDEAVEVKEEEAEAPKPEVESETEVEEPTDNKEEDNLLLANVEGLEQEKEETPVAEVAAAGEEAEEKQPEDYVLASALDALSLHHESLSDESEHEYEEESDEEYSESEEEALPLHLNGPLRGLPTPKGSHIRFDDERGELVSPRRRVFLRGLPEPTGTVTIFDDEEEEKEQ